MISAYPITRSESWHSVANIPAVSSHVTTWSVQAAVSSPKGFRRTYTFCLRFIVYNKGLVKLSIPTWNEMEFHYDFREITPCFMVKCHVNPCQKHGLPGFPIVSPRNIANNLHSHHEHHQSLQGVAPVTVSQVGEHNSKFTRVQDTYIALVFMGTINPLSHH